MFSLASSPARTILLAGFVAGSLDILAAFLVYCLIKQATTPMRMLQYISSSVFGQTAFSGGWNTALIGLSFHFMIAMTFAAFYYWIFPFFPFLNRRKVEAGLLYGLLIWAIMNLLMLPLFFHSIPNLHWEAVGLGAGILMLCVGLPISLIIRQTHPHTTFTD